MEFPSDESAVKAHMEACIGCALINQNRKDQNDWLPCFEHAQRNIQAIYKLMELYNYNPENPEVSYPTVIGRDGKPTVNLMSLVDDITSRYQRGTLTPGEHRR